MFALEFASQRYNGCATLVRQLVLCAVALTSVVGCSRPDPVGSLKRLGVEVERNDSNEVVVANFPTSTTDSGLQSLKEIKTIQEVDLAGTQITDAGLENLAGLTGLTRLELNNTSISDAGLVHLKGLTNLKSLSLGDTSVTDAGLLEHLKDLKNLTDLDLSRESKPQPPKPRSWRGALRFGIDLAGGTNLVFQVDREQAKALGKDVDSRLMDQMVGAVGRRINPSGTEEVTVRRVGADRIEVIIPGADRQIVEEKKRTMTRLGSLEFEILANMRDHSDVINAAEKLPKNVRDYHPDKRLIATWRDVMPGEELSDHGEVRFRSGKVEGETVRQVLVMVTPEKNRVTGRYLLRADPSSDENGGPAVSFTFNDRGAWLFQKLTSANKPKKDGFKRRLAVLLDNKVHTAPNLNETISRNGQISGNFTQDEVTELINVLNAGALEVPIEPNPISEFTISPLLGADVQEKGKNAIIMAAGAVLVFMLAYYLFAGVVANVCLVLNLILVVGTMALIEATFTLPGLAGLVLTIGMAVDANVLIFERIREESARGSSLRMAIQNGFSRAFTTIVDANVTTLIVAVVLYMIGTDQVRGFAVTLFIGIVMSMFTSLYFGRIIFDVIERKRWLKRVKMLSIVGTTRLDFIGKKMIAAACSLVLILAGLGSLIARGQENLDIDFSGGTMVTFEFVNKAGVEPPGIDEARGTLQGQFGTGITLEMLTLAEGQLEADRGERFRLRTTEQNLGEVRHKVAAAFAGSPYELRRVTMEVADIEPISDEAASNANQEQFVGGHQTELTFNGPVPAATISDYLSAAISTVNKEYSQPSSLIELTGTEGSGLESTAGEVQEFTKMQLKAWPNLAEADLTQALGQMQKTMEDTPIFDEVNSFDSSVAGEMQQSAVMAILVSLVAIVAYIWFRFQRITFGLAAVAALVHDVLVVLGLVALASFASSTTFGRALDLYDFKINLPMIAAFLTIIGYSLNDTIVVFDRIREVRGKNPALTDVMVNTSLNQTLARTLLTSITTLVVVLILYIFGGEGIHGFAFCLVLGVAVGTYSSIYVASPVLLWLMSTPENGNGRVKGAR